MRILSKVKTACRVARNSGLTGIYSTFMYRYFWPLGARVSRNAAKHWEEIRYWRSQAATGTLDNSWYQDLYTKHFGLQPSDYSNKSILDLGCGPLGSLEWAESASERVGLDPLISSYRGLGLNSHKMQYVEGRSEDIPFGNEHFDYVTCFNALDHVDDVQLTLAEVVRVLKRGGKFLVFVDIGHNPTLSEPHELQWTVLDQILDRCSPLLLKRFEQKGGAAKSIEQGCIICDGHLLPKEGVLQAMLEKH